MVILLRLCEVPTHLWAAVGPQTKLTLTVLAHTFELNVQIGNAYNYTL